MYFLGWIGLVAISLWLSLLAFLWALRSGQFSDQTRARYLPLRDEMDLERVEKSSMPRMELIALLGIGVLGVLGMVASVVLSLCHFKG